MTLPLCVCVVAREVNGQLDTEMQKRRVDSLVRGRLKPPSIQTVYASLRDHNKIIKLQVKHGDVTPTIIHYVIFSRQTE